MKIPRSPTSVSSRRQPTKPVEAPQGPDALDGNKPCGARGSASAAAVHIHVAHLAAPQGSHRQGFGKSVKETNPRTEPYREAVAKACEDFIDDRDDWVPMDGPLQLGVAFWMMPPPKSDPDRVYPHVAPDLDKLIRSTCDGITRGRLWADDARVVRIVASKYHAATAEETGVDIEVRRLP